MPSLLQSVLSAFLLSSCLVGCGGSIEVPSPDTGSVVTTPDGVVLHVELADDPQERSEGLMWREHLDENAGMWFAFDEEETLSFWMKNTLIPLDVLYISSDFRIVDIQTMQPCPAESLCPGYPSAAPAQHALELNAGRAESLGLQLGDTLEITF